MLQDRGNKKWSTSLMLPEHVNLLKKALEEQNDIKKPQVDEHQLEEMNLIFQLALKNNSEVKIKYFSNNRIHVIKGILTEIDYLYRKTCIVYEDNSALKINLLDIVDIEIVY
ncbi:YolD-like family protein [Lysinibacillus sp. OL1_EC]|uniref:YolD-like family protein n=1 Tax=Lysinibacillus TaxID=400634 RepID=UPI000691D9D4|nr:MULTISPECIES: YolD-like family protein [Lysinibacillus]MCM0627439.1 YolD-like family protein [Lysinibacillus sp. OL1_EC]TBV84805.1 YolD-like family protein [Lysinibacillus sp. OL1]